MALTRRELIRNVGVAAGAASVFGLGIHAGAPLVAGPEPAEAVKPYTLPPLPYEQDALEPHLDKETVALHHGKHHAAYVAGLNGSLEKLVAARAAGDAALISALTRAMAFHGSGHVLHAIYWTSVKPGGGGKPPDRGLGKLIERDFGSFEGFRAQFAAVTNAVGGSGWGVLAYEPLGQRLVILGVEKHENVLFAGATPLLVCDVWEHAYYLKYQNRRAEYVETFLKNLVDWEPAAKRLDAAIAGLADG